MSNLQLIYPPALAEGGTIAIVSPACHPIDHWIEAAKALFESAGYRVFVHAQNTLRNGQLAGDDQTRAAALMEMFADPAIAAIICARGGVGSYRLLDKLDYEVIRNNPKIFCGFSDITTLLNVIRQHTGMVTFHGPLCWNFAQPGSDSRTFTDMLRAFQTSGQPARFAYNEPECIVAGMATGRLIGGNISLLQQLIGTPYDWNADGAILLIEDVEEVLRRFDRILYQFKMAGKLEGLRGVILGEMVDITDDPPWGKSITEILTELLPKGIPFCTNFPAGHGAYLTTLPIGAPVTLTVGPGETVLEFSGA